MNTDVVQVGSIVFYSSASDCIKEFEELSWIQKAISIIHSFGNLIKHFATKICRWIQCVKPQMIDYNKIPNSQKNKLIVCLHSMGDNPEQFKNIVKHLDPNEFSKCDLYTPSIVKKTHQTISEMVEPIFQAIQNWAGTEGTKEVTLVAISSGAPVAKVLCDEIPKQCKSIKKLTIISIAGVWQHYHTETNSDTSPQYKFIAAAHDWQMSRSSTLPELSADLQNSTHCEYALIPGHGHLSLVEAHPKTYAELICPSSDGEYDIFKSKSLVEMANSKSK